MNVPFTRAGICVKRASKWQVGSAILTGFVVGYLLLPYMFPPTPAAYNVRNTGSRDKSLNPFGFTFQHSQGQVVAPDKNEKWSELLKTRVRERGVYFSKSGQRFMVEGKEKLILSGAIHYFRVVPAYWEDRLLRLKAAGLNTIETYVPWNLHEPLPGQYDFTGILDLAEYIRTAHRLGLHVIIRPGPYICAEWEMGGLPAWLLHYRDMQLRTTHREYLAAIGRYFKHLFDVLIPLQSSFGGPIIAFQLENEYGHFRTDSEEISRNYMYFLYQLLREMGVVELLFTSDGKNRLKRTLQMSPAEEVLLTVNFMNNKGALEYLHTIQPNKPRMVMEFWTGWFVHWNEDHLARNHDARKVANKMVDMIKAGVSINLYMFHGGTNFGFMNGGNWDKEIHRRYQPTTTSYDYDAPVSECGDITEKYIAIRKAISDYAPDSMNEKNCEYYRSHKASVVTTAMLATRGAVSPLPPIPDNLPKRAYNETRLTLYIPITSTLQYTHEPYYAEHPVLMEYMPINKGWGQGYGYILYRTTIPRTANKITVPYLKDFGIAMINGKPVRWLSSFSSETFIIPKDVHDEAPVGEKLSLDILVENAGHASYGFPLENRKGINGTVKVDGVEHKRWTMYSLEFKPSYLDSMDSGGMWLSTPSTVSPGPSLFKGTFIIQGAPCDTFVDMKGWGKGILIINGANLGRYWNVGPQRTLYVPGPILKEGINKVMIFELHQPKFPQTIVFRDSPILDQHNVPP